MRPKVNEGGGIYRTTIWPGFYIGGVKKCISNLSRDDFE
jgi:hypothetical protein